MYNMPRAHITFLITLCIFLAVNTSGLKALSDTHADFYIAADGNDLNDGSFEKPFATLLRARNAVRELKKTIKDASSVFLFLI